MKHCLINLRIPDSKISFQIVLKNESSLITSNLRQHFQNFITADKPSSVLTITFLEDTHPYGVYCALNPVVKESRKKLYVHHAGLFEGEIDFSQTDWKGNFYCSRTPHHAFVLIRLFGLLQTIYNNGIPLHASSVALQKKGFVFFGNQGDGKSTISRLANGDILADDTALIFQKKQKYMVCATPFDYKFKNSAPLTHSLGACIRVQHITQKNELQKLPNAGLAKQLMHHVRPDVGFLSHSPTFLQKLFASVVTFSQSFDMFYQLDFRQDRQFLPIIKKIPPIKHESKAKS